MYLAQAFRLGIDLRQLRTLAQGKGVMQSQWNVIDAGLSETMCFVFVLEPRRCQFIEGDSSRLFLERNRAIVWVNSVFTDLVKKLTSVLKSDNFEVCSSGNTL